METINVIIEETRKKMIEAMEQELFGAFNASAVIVSEEQMRPAAALYAKPLSAEDLEEFKRKWMEASQKPGKIIKSR